MSNGDRYQTVEERLGVIKGILSPLPEQVSTLFERLAKFAEQQAEKHTSIDHKIKQFDDEIGKTCGRDRANCPYYKRFGEMHKIENSVESLLKLQERLTQEDGALDDVAALKRFKDDLEGSRSSWKKYLAMFAVSFLSFVLGSLTLYVVLYWIYGISAISGGG